MARATLNDAIKFLKDIDIWHEFKYSEQQIMTVAPELQKYGQSVLNEALDLIKMKDNKPSPARIMRICDDIVRRNKEVLKAENFDESPDEWMTSTEYAQSQGFDSLRSLIQNKIEAETKGGGDAINVDTIASSIEDLEDPF
tara:strand:+ start:240 stop:662 length:423 start_codon:yes stop_codon:yes gene_type:complete